MNFVLFDLLIDGIDMKIIGLFYIGESILIFRWESFAKIAWFMGFSSGQPRGRDGFYKKAFFRYSVSRCYFFRQTIIKWFMQVCDNFESDMRVECPCKDYHILNVIWSLITYMFPYNYTVTLDIWCLVGFVSERGIFWIVIN